MGLLSFGFILLLAVVCLLNWWVPVRWRVTLLLVASLVFYGVWNLGLLALLLGATLVNHLILRQLAPGARARLFWLRLGIVWQCGLLFAFKYLSFFVSSGEALLRRAGVATDPLVLEVVVPLGLSYFSLKAIALLVDTYRDQSQAEVSLAEHALYLLFFPSLTAGPIDRPRSFLAQLAPAARPNRHDALTRGADLLFVGLLKKVVIANGLAPAVDQAFAGNFATTGAAVLAALTYAFYIYADFSGYTDIARGAAAWLGFDLAVNFRRPYASRSTSEFWQRWHISLSTWLRDYIFLPLGGAFRSRERAYANLLLTMLIAGLWHGASWLFVLWGLYIGVLLVGHRVLQPGLRRARRRLHLHGQLRRIVETGFTFALISAGWILFRSTSLDQVASALRGGTASAEAWRGFLVGVAPFAVAMLGLDLLAGEGEPVLLRGDRLPWWGKPMVLAAGFYAIFVLGTATQSFVYAQF